MKKIYYLLTMLSIICFSTSCGSDDEDELNNTTVVIKDDGTSSNGSRFVGIDDQNFYLDYIKYTVEEGHLIVSGYDKVGFSGNAKIVAGITYKGNSYEVLGIKNYAFYKCSRLTSLTIPSSVTSIGESAFEGCYGLTSLTIPSSVTSFGDFAFRSCSGLTSLTIYSIVIGYCAFEYCNGLTSLTISSSVTSIGAYAFSGCSGLTSIHCLWTTPPRIDYKTFNEIYEKSTLYVPKGSLEAYKSTYPWRNFHNIVEE